MYTCYRLELSPSLEDIAILESQSRIAHNLYNDLNALVRKELKAFQDSKSQSFNPLNAYQLRNQVPIIKSEHPVYKTIYSSVAKNTSFRLSSGIAIWLDARKHPEKYHHKVSLPHFRSWKREGFFSIKYEDPFVGYRIKDNALSLSFGKDENNKRLGLSVKFKKRFKIDKSYIKTLEIVKNKNRYYACFSCELPDKPKKSINKIIALDPNHKNLVVGYASDNTAIEFNNLWFSKIIDKQIDQIKSKRDHCKKLSRRWSYLNARVQQLHRVQRDRTKVGLRTIANYLCKRYDLIGIGDYVPRKAKFKRMNRAMVNQTHIGEFRQILEHTCNKSGKTYIKYNERNTTKACSSCGCVGESLDPSIREWCCKACGDHHNRDENAAINGYYRVVEEQFKVSCSDYLGKVRILSRYICFFDGCRIQEQEIKSIKANDASEVGNQHESA